MFILLRCSYIASPQRHVSALPTSHLQIHHFFFARQTTQLAISNKNIKHVLLDYILPTYFASGIHITSVNLEIVPLNCLDEY